ncbi:hypothetical protein DEU56DRAFT_760178 [Suillus clintonianus]|uniref:uncharacterized protein n=1 Tax=Suillus clintonianus TaxID=1904413 RepID=UPI001B85FADF|nr:uncharacterized protein DEU56DRAFT_760178 [Suillus clintonianus]KAG2123099.1 hypothetical protein DEU56DRAFT_760178 [Suillus clintonianus]
MAQKDKKLQVTWNFAESAQYHDAAGRDHTALDETSRSEAQAARISQQKDFPGLSWDADDKDLASKKDPSARTGKEMQQLRVMPTGQTLHGHIGRTAKREEISPPIDRGGRDNEEGREERGGLGREEEERGGSRRGELLICEREEAPRSTRSPKERAHATGCRWSSEVAMSPMDPRYSRYVKRPEIASVEVVVRPGSNRHDRQVLSKDEYRRSGGLINISKITIIPAPSRDLQVAAVQEVDGVVR